MGFVESRIKEMGVGVDVLVTEKSDRECEIRDMKREVNDLMRKLESERRELIGFVMRGIRLRVGLIFSVRRRID